MARIVWHCVETSSRLPMKWIFEKEEMLEILTVTMPFLSPGMTSPWTVILFGIHATGLKGQISQMDLYLHQEQFLTWDKGFLRWRVGPLWGRQRMRPAGIRKYKNLVWQCGFISLLKINTKHFSLLTRELKEVLTIGTCLSRWIMECFKCKLVRKMLTATALLFNITLLLPQTLLKMAGIRFLGPIQI